MKRIVGSIGHILKAHSVQSTMMGDLNMWVDYRGPLSTVYNDGGPQHVGRLQRSTQYSLQ